MRVPDRGVRVDGGIAPPVRKPCKLPGLARPGFHRKPRPANGGDPAPVRRTGALFAARPFPGSRRMAAMPRARGRAINREHARRRTRRTGIAAPGPEPRTAKPAPGHKIFPDLPRRLALAEHEGCPVPRPGARGGAGAPWQAGDLRHRPGQPVYRRGLRRHARRRHPRPDGWARPAEGQCLHRAAASRARPAGKPWTGRRAWPTPARGPHARGRGSGGKQLDRLRRKERPDFQPRNRPQRSRPRGPLQIIPASKPRSGKSCPRRLGSAATCAS